MQQTQRTERLTGQQVNSIIYSLRTYFKYSEKPHPDEVVVFPTSVKPVWDDPGYYEAIVKISVDYCGTKVQKNHVKFKLRDNKAILNTITYI